MYGNNDRCNCGNGRRECGTPQSSHRTGNRLDGSQSSFSICIPALNEGKYISRLLGSLLSQQVCIGLPNADEPFTRYEIIVAIHPATADGTKGICDADSEKFRQRDIPFTTTRGGAVSTARNNAVAASDPNTRWLLFIDADCELPDRYFLCRLLQYLHDNPEVKFASVDMMPHPNERTVAGAFVYNAGNTWHRLTGYPYEGFLLIDRDLFDAVGGWNTKVTFIEGVELTDRIKRATGNPHLLTILPNDDGRPDGFTVYTSNRKSDDPMKLGRLVGNSQRAVTCHSLPPELCTLDQLTTNHFDGPDSPTPDDMDIIDWMYANMKPDIIIRLDGRDIPMKQTWLGAWPNDHGGIAKQYREINPFDRPSAHLVIHRDGTRSVHFDNANPHAHPLIHLTEDVIKPLAQGKTLSNPIAIIQ